MTICAGSNQPNALSVVRAAQLGIRTRRMDEPVLITEVLFDVSVWKRSSAAVMEVLGCSASLALRSALNSHAEDVDLHRSDRKHGVPWLLRWVVPVW